MLHAHRYIIRFTVALRFTVKIGLLEWSDMYANERVETLKIKNEIGGD